MRVSADQQATTVPMVALDPKERYLALLSPTRKHLSYSAAKLYWSHIFLWNSCPWITNVGATKVYPGHTAFETESAANDPSTGFASGGGFSNIYPVPQYQAAAVARYFETTNLPYASYSGEADLNTTSGAYNSSGRGYPDVAANGDNIAVWANGRFALEGGTSGSTSSISHYLSHPLIFQLG